MRVYKPTFKKKRPDGTVYDYESPFYYMEFELEGRVIHKSTRLKDRKKAESLMAKHRTELVMGNAGIKPKKRAPTLAEFLDKDFLPFQRQTRGETEPNTVEYYECRAAHLKGFAPLANARLDEIGHDERQAFIAHMKTHRKSNGDPLAIATINHDLRTLRLALNLAVEWGRVDTVKKLKRWILPGENQRRRALSEPDAEAYLAATTAIAHQLERDYAAALAGIRATQRGQQPRRPDAFRLRDFALLIIDAGLRPDECYNLTRESIRDGKVCVDIGKTPAAIRQVPILTDRLRAALEMRLAATPAGGWLFPNPETDSGHIEQSTLRDQHEKAVVLSGVTPFEPYVLRHTCLTWWSRWMDVPRLQKYAGHEDIKTTMRYVHPADETTQEAKARYEDARARLAKTPATTPATAKTADSEGPDEATITQ